MTVRTFRYELPALSDHTDSWSIVFVDETGCVAVLSDYGNWAHRWWTPHTGKDDIRDFIASMGTDYAANKLGTVGDNDQYDGRATQEKIRAHIEKFETGDVLRHEMCLWEDTDFDEERGFTRWWESTKLDEPWTFQVRRRSPRLEHWVKVSLPRLQQAIRAELDLERGSAP